MTESPSDRPDGAAARRDDAPARPASPLTERYVAVALEHIPVAQHTAVEPALRDAIAHEVEERYDDLLGDELITRDDIEVDVLEDMGDPERVAAAMSSRPLYLIGPRYFLDYKHVLLWVLGIVTPVVAALAMVSAAHDGADMSSMLVHGIGAAVTAALYAGALTTLGFAVAERVATARASDSGPAWTIDQLPQPRRTTISAGQTATEVVTALVLAVAIIWQHLSPSVFTEQGVGVPFLNPDYWPWLWSGLAALLGIEALAAIARHVRGRWTLAGALMNLAILTVLSGTVVWLLLDHSFLNDEFFEEVGWPTDELPTATLENWAAGVIAVIWAIDVLVGFFHAWRSRTVRG